MKRVLVIYYSQSGQLGEILKSLMRPLEESGQVAVTYEQLKPVRDYPFPWKPLQFFDVQPESVLEIPTALEPVAFDPDEPYDLIVLGYQPWFLSPSIPISSFLQSSVASKCLAGRPVVTVIGSRNMWLMAQEQVKQRLASLSARLVLNVPFVDRAPNIVSLFTIVAWMFTGNRTYFGALPRAGVSDEDVANAAGAGEVLKTFLAGAPEDPFERMPAEVNPRFMAVEKTGRRVFRLWARLIRSRGESGGRPRNLTVRVFMVYLAVVITLLFPLTYVVYQVTRIVNPRGLKERARYFSGLGPG